MKLRKLLFTLFAVVALGGGSIIAFAAWTANGNGTGYASAGSISISTNAQTPAGSLYPGKSTGLTVQVRNDTPIDLYVTNIQLASGGAQVVSGVGCTTSNYGVSYTTGQNFSQSNVKVPSGDTANFTLANAISMDNTSDNACQSAVFSVPVTVSATS